MNFFWNCGIKDIMARDVMEFFNEHGKTWNNQATATFLKDLQNIGMLRVEIRDGKYYYYPTMSEEDYTLLPAKKILRDMYKGSMGDFITALAKPENLSKEEIDELRKILDNADDFDD